MDQAEELRGKVWPVLDQGEIRLVDWMGDDSAICAAARISYGKGTKRASEDRDLIRYLYRHAHHTPFEMCEIKLGLKLPIDVTRQWWRHRTASINEYSTRYSEAIEAAQKTPVDGWRLQSTGNKQGSGGFIRPLGASTGIAENLCREEIELQEHARKVYEHRLGCGVAREQARKDLPLCNYTAAYWKCDLRNVLHFLGLRMDSHAQAEIRAYADIIGHEIVARLFPVTWEAFCDYSLHSIRLSRLEIEAIRSCQPLASDNKREQAEWADKASRLGLNRQGSVIGDPAG